MAQKRLLTVGQGDPEELAPFLRARLGVGEEEVLGWLRQGAVYVGKGRPRGGTESLRPGARVTVYVPGPPLAAAVAGPGPAIVYQDEDLLVVDKPAGMLVQPARSGGLSLLSALTQVSGPSGPGEGPYLLHRLDRDASGLVILCRRKAACGPLQRALAEGAVKREYLAVVQGRPEPASGRIDLRIGTDPRDSRRRVALPEAAPGGQPATTLYQLKELLGGDRALLSLQLVTGRTHQLRVHLSAVGHPIVGDRTYGGAHAPRLMLHASALSFPHPGTGATVTCTSANNSTMLAGHVV